MKMTSKVFDSVINYANGHVQYAICSVHYIFMKKLFSRYIRNICLCRATVIGVCSKEMCGRWSCEVDKLSNATQI